MSLEYDPMSPRWRDDPYPAYRRLRDEAPVHFSAESNTYCVSRYDDVQQVLNDPDTFSSRAMFTMLMMAGQERMSFGWTALRGMFKMAIASRTRPGAVFSARNLIAADGPLHTGMRSIVNRGFTPRRVGAWQPRAKELVADCMAKLEHGGSFDLVRDLAVPLPVTLIAEMIGVESARLADFKRWSDVVVHYAAGPGRANRFAPEFIDTMCELTRYLRGVTRERRENPQDDLISTILTSQEGEDGLSEFEVVMFVTLLLVAGNETTTNLIGNAVGALLDHPHELARVAADPTLIPSLIEETLRFDAPIQLVFRNATRDTELAGVGIPSGAWVVPLLGSANRDERRFEDPDRFDVARNPQGHVGFGFGPHFCLGASLARLEATAALEALVPVLPTLRKTDAGPARVDSFLVRGPSQLELAPAA